jgi:hypothetical protein
MQEKLLDQSTRAAGEMAKKLDIIAGQAAAVPILTAEINCTTNDKENEYPNHTVGILPLGDFRELSENRVGDGPHDMIGMQKWTDMDPHLDLTPNIAYDCTLTIRNVGNRVQDHYKVFFSYKDMPLSSSVEEGGPWAIHMRDRWSFDEENSTMYDRLGNAANVLGIIKVPSRPISEEEGWSLINGEKTSIMVMEGGPLAPISKSDGDHHHFRLLCESKSNPNKSYKDWYTNWNGQGFKKPVDPEDLKEWERLKEIPEWQAGILVINIDHGGGRQWEVQVTLGNDLP